MIQELTKDLRKSGKLVGVTDHPYIVNGSNVVFDEVVVKGDLSGDLEYNGKKLRITKIDEIIGLIVDRAGTRGPVWKGVECQILS